MTNEIGIPQHDVDVIRRLAERKAKIAADPLNLERKRLWLAHDAGGPSRPMVLAEVGGVMNEALPETILECGDKWARSVEMGLRVEIYQFDVLKDDHVVEPYVDASWKVQTSGYGVQAIQHQADNDGKLGARRWEPPIKDIAKDFDKLHPRTFSVDRNAAMAEKQRLEKLFAGILPVRIRERLWWTFGLTIVAIDLIGLENLMLFMFDDPEGLHRLMKFLRDDHLAFAQWAEKEGVLSLNNENDYIGSGSMGYTKDLPARGYTPDHVRMKDQWVLLESQETVGVGPDQFAEFIFPYQLSIDEKFGKSYYGCCEPVHTRWHVIKKLPNLARVSISPWANEEFMAAELGRKYVYSRKPSPAMISTSVFDEDAIKADLKKTLTLAKGCRVELIMKDVHTLNGQPERLPRWVRLAREAIDEVK